MKLAEIGRDLRRFWRALDRLNETPILDLNKKLVVPDGPFDYLTTLSGSQVVKDLIEIFQLTSEEIYEWQTKFPAEIKLLWCLLDLISRIERTSIKVGIFWEMLDKKNNYGMLWKWTDADKQKLSKALELMGYILHQLGLSAGKIVVSHKDYRGLSVPDISPELKQLSIKLMNLEQIAPVEILVALQINPALLDITLPTGLEQLCNLMVNNTLDYYRAWLWAFRNIRSSFAQAWSVDDFYHTSSTVTSYKLSPEEKRALAGYQRYVEEQSRPSKQKKEPMGPSEGWPFVYPESKRSLGLGKFVVNPNANYDID